MSLEKEHSVIEDFYRGHHVFCTGVTGMLGTAYVCRLALYTRVFRIYALVRGGEKSVKFHTSPRTLTKTTKSDICGKSGRHTCPQTSYKL